MKTKEELNALKEEVETLNKKLDELSDEELQQVAGGTWDLLPKDHYENVILSVPNQSEAHVQTYKKDIGSDKNAKVIFS